MLASPAQTVIPGRKHGRRDSQCEMRLCFDRLLPLTSAPKSIGKLGRL
jgi:hypothetical protein